MGVARRQPIGQHGLEVRAGRDNAGALDADVLAVPALYFNAARLDRSIRLSTTDYERIARPRVAAIASSQAPSPSTLLTLTAPVCEAGAGVGAAAPTPVSSAS